MGVGCEGCFQPSRGTRDRQARLGVNEAKPCLETAAVTAPKPPEFGTAGDNWSQEGGLVQVNWQPLLPERHSPWMCPLEGLAGQTS